MFKEVNVRKVITKEKSRIFYSGWVRYAKSYQSEELQNRLFKSNILHPSSLPASPNTSIYLVECEHNYCATPWREYAEKKDLLFIKYNPGGEVKIGWSWETKERSNRISFSIKKEDKFIINYDAIGIEELETLKFYLETRIGREEYLHNIPMLKALYEERKKELDQEIEFSKLVKSQLKDDETTITLKDILNAIQWWKLKNKWKRNLKDDETKALRMILRKLKKEEINELSD